MFWMAKVPDNNSEVYDVGDRRLTNDPWLYDCAILVVVIVVLCIDSAVTLEINHGLKTAFELQARQIDFKHIGGLVVGVTSMKVNDTIDDDHIVGLEYLEV